MSLSIRTNIASLNAQRSLYSTQTSLDSSLSRLSSGFRITKAGDDAAGLGISSKLESQIRSYSQATRNANDGLSVVQASEAALSEQANILTRLRELAMQSSSDGVGNSERRYIDAEGQKLLSELQRISQTTEYNGTKLLDGSQATLDFQVGIAATGNDVISLNTLNATTAAAGAQPAGTVQAVAASLPAAEQTIISDFRTAVAGGANPLTASSTVGSAANTLGGYQYAGTKGAGYAYNAYVTAVYAIDGNYAPTQITPGSETAGQLAGLSLLTAIQGGGAGGGGSTNGSNVLTAAFATFATTLATTGGDVNAAFAAVSGGGGGTAVGSAGSGVTGLFLAAREMTTGEWDHPVDMTSAGVAAGLRALGYSYVPPAAASSGGLGVAGLSLTTKASSLSALASIDSALAAVSSNRATLGATGNRLQSAISNIQAFSESLSAANSRIKDVDVAEETSRMSRSQILMQAGVSVLAQANQMPQMALKLLG